MLDAKRKRQREREQRWDIKCEHQTEKIVVLPKAKRKVTIKNKTNWLKRKWGRISVFSHIEWYTVHNQQGWSDQECSRHGRAKLKVLLTLTCWIYGSLAIHCSWMNCPLTKLCGKPITAETTAVRLSAYVSRCNEKSNNELYSSCSIIDIWSIPRCSTSWLASC